MTTAIPFGAYVLTNASLPLAVVGGAALGVGVATLRERAQTRETKDQSAMTFVYEAAKKLSP
jgi:hypothetical protein